MDGDRIRTSEPDWAKRIAEAYRDQKPFTLIDDAGIGVDLNGKSLLQALQEAGFTLGEALGVLLSIGLMAGGGKMIQHALKITHFPTMITVSILGVVMSLTGFGAAYRVLTGITAGSVKVGPKSFEVKFASAA